MSSSYMSEQQLYDKANAAMGGWLTRGWLRHAIRRGDIKHVAQVGNRRLYDDSSFDQLIDLLKVPA